MTPEEIAVWEPLLKRIPLFSSLSAEELARIAARMQTLSLPKGSTLFKQGDEPEAFYLITSGQVRIVHRGADGKEVMVAFLGRGEAIGEGGLLTGAPRSMTVRLDATCEFLKLSRKDFEEVLRETPSLLLHLSRVLARRLVPQAAPARRKGPEAAQIISLNAGLSRPDRLLLTIHLALGLMEQTRRRVLLVDMNPDAGAISRSLGLKDAPVTEELIREINLRDPGMIRALAQQHPSGLAVLNIPATTLGGRLYGAIYLFLNFLRETHDLVLVALSGELGDVEKTVLHEADQVLLAGTAGHLPQFRQLEAELLSTIDAKKMVRVWLGEVDMEETHLTLGVQSQEISWSEAMAEEFERHGPYKPMESHPKSLRAVERLARRLGGLKVGLALGTGAALGHSLIGILKVFKREGIPIDMIAGTSAGSLIGGFAALGMEPEEIEELALRIDMGWVYENLFWDITLPRSGLFAGQTMLRFVRSYFGTKEFSELAIPFACVAADIETGEEVVLKEGRVAEAIRASCGLPLLFAPMRLGGRYLVDGGLVNPVPASVVADMGADILLAVNLTAPAAERPTKLKARRLKEKSSLLNAPLASLRNLALPDALKAPSMFEVFFQMIYTMEYEIAQSRLDLADVLINPNLAGFHWTEMHRARELIAAGERVAEEYVPQIKALLPYFANYCQFPVRLATHL